MTAPASIADIGEGSGDRPGRRCRRIPRYRLEEDGSRILSSYDQGSRFCCPLPAVRRCPAMPAHRYAKAASAGLSCAELGFGETGAGGVVPNATMIWLIELVSLNADAE